MKKGSTAAAKQRKNISQQQLTIGLDLGDRSSWYCVMDEAGRVVQEQRLSTTPGRLIGAQLFGIRGWDPHVFGFSILALGPCSAAASILPAHRAASTDPLKALRADWVIWVDRREPAGAPSSW